MGSTGTGRITITGDKALIDNLRAMGRAARAKAIRPAVTAAAKPMQAAMVLHAPYRTGALKRSIDTKVKTYKDAVVAIIGPRWDQIEVQTFRSIFQTSLTNATVRRVQPGRYAHLVEGGTHRSKKNPFAERAFMQTAAESQAILETMIVSNILSAIKEPAK